MSLFAVAFEVEGIIYVHAKNIEEAQKRAIAHASQVSDFSGARVDVNSWKVHEQQKGKENA